MNENKIIIACVIVVICFIVVGIIGKKISTVNSETAITTDIKEIEM